MALQSKLYLEDPNIVAEMGERAKEQATFNRKTATSIFNWGGGRRDNLSGVLETVMLM